MTSFYRYMDVINFILDSLLLATRSKDRKMALSTQGGDSKKRHLVLKTL
jgi:hypothetical protein